MVYTIIAVILCGLLGLLAVGAFIIAHEERKERYKAENELNEAYKHEEQNADTITEANKTKADARTGDHSSDIEYMAGKLHDYAHK